MSFRVDTTTDGRYKADVSVPNPYCYEGSSEKRYLRKRKTFEKKKIFSFMITSMIIFVHLKKERLPTKLKKIIMRV